MHTRILVQDGANQQTLSGQQRQASGPHDRKLHAVQLQKPFDVQERDAIRQRGQFLWQGSDDAIRHDWQTRRSHPAKPRRGNIA